MAKPVRAHPRALLPSLILGAVVVGAVALAGWLLLLFVKGTVVLISYRYTPTTTGSRAVITNQLMGFAPTLLMTLNGIYKGNEYTVTLYAVVASKLSLATKQDDFIIPDFDFECFANAAGNVIDIDFSE